jgi:hypothetical protein
MREQIVNEEPPVHYVLAERCEETSKGFDATIVVACDHEVQAQHWFTKELKLVTCPGCGEAYMRPHARVYRFVEGRSIGVRAGLQA